MTSFQETVRRIRRRLDRLVGLHHQEWRRWRTDPPPRDTQVFAKFENDDRVLSVRTCKHGCCVDLDGMSMILPDYWKQPNKE